MVIDGQVSVFDLEEQEQQEEVKINFTKEQQNAIEELKKKDWIEYSLYASGVVIFIVNEDTNVNIVPQDNVESKYNISGNIRSYFIEIDGSYRYYSIEIVRWKDSIKTIKNKG